MKSAKASSSTGAPGKAGKGEDLRQAALDHLWIQSGYAWNDAIAEDGIVIMEEGHGSTLTSANGHKVLDFASGLWLANVGYGRKEIADVMAAQAGRLHYTKHPWPTEATVRAAVKLASLTPGTLNKVFFTSGGSEANETALKMAIQYHRLTGQPQRTQFIGRDLSYHGSSFATMSVGGARTINRNVFQSQLLTDVQLIDGPGHPNLRGANLTGAAAARLEEAITKVGPDKVAAFIGEPISNSAGIHIPDPDYWPTIRQICDRHGILLICDEVITGFGRTGKMFGVQHWNFVPDIMTIAKGVTSGYAPLGAAIAKDEIAERFRPGTAEAFQHVVTYGGQAVACAAVLSNIGIIEREGLVERSAKLGTYLLQNLRKLDKHPSYGDARGLGLMCALQLTKNRRTGEAFTLEERTAVTHSLTHKAYRKGLNLVGTAEKLAFMPPLVVSEAELDRAVDIVDSTLTEIEREFEWWRS
jgi:adenosylmethionine-8-amino-7-oxononanoate aminotransferase